MTDLPLVTEARVRLDDPLDMARRLCAHFTRHATVTPHAEGGVIESSFGRAEVRAEGGLLHLRAEAADATALYVVKNALAEHLVSFVEAEQKTPLPAFEWSGSGADIPTIPFFHPMRVVGARQVTPHMRRLTLAGADVSHFDSSAGLHVRLLIPPAGRAPVWPSAAPDGRTLWPSGKDTLVRRVYTVRAIDHAAGTIDIDMVLHADDDAPGSNWALRARRGDPVGVMGPGGGLPPDADTYVLAGDETALPVISRLVDMLPVRSRVIVFLEVADSAEVQPIAPRPGLSVTWLYREGVPAGRAGLLEAALRAMEWPREGRCYVLAGCEHGAARAIRAFLARERGMAKADTHVAAYWRLGRGGDSQPDDADGQEQE